MKSHIKKLNIIPSWLILFVDVLCVLFSAYLAIILRDNFQLPSKITRLEYLVAPLAIALANTLSFIIFKTYKIVVRYTNTKDVAKIFLSCLFGSLLLILFNEWSYHLFGRFIVPISVLIMEFFISTVVLIFYRFSFKIFYLEMINPTKLKKNIIIFGAGEAGITTKRSLDRDTKSKYNVLAFFDDDTKKIGKNLENIIVLSSKQLPDYLSKNNISFLIISIQNLSPVVTNRITEICLQYNVKVLIVPPVKRWINGELSFKQIKKVKIEDLLERDPICLDETLIKKDLVGQTVLITGAAGSIGSEIVRQIMKFCYKQLILIDNAETPTFYLQNECLLENGMKNIDIKIIDICDVVKMEEVIKKYSPSIIYHAAAYKHVPMMEGNVQASISVNVKGTKQLADLAVKYGVKKFVMVSTDKAVNPTNVMGASKRIAEMYVQSLNFHQNKTKFITTRFGNVLGSNGSVIPIFKTQIENGGPITITHPDITRYFMTIPEACQLVINAGAMGNGGEIFIFDMGKSVRIYDLATKMIKLSGLTLGKDIKIEFTGLRPGEKLYEELLANQENTIKTDHQKIMTAKVRIYPYSEIKNEIEQLIDLQYEEPHIMVKKMKSIVPEFISNNSEFEADDHPVAKKTENI
ncbi:MAG: nucleoside-diphosphate sugar epimerase/dehydratase [Bacteroidales bacterium]